ncbi:uncharacterized protein DDB_G0271670-like [Periophthalmus magnuspinnatus]|uniref:uncharacterized protein DDB_G0271670-like n=1 Tax=Periophthalmus magnuspinnatus TaxID=409849 RepID=UPI00243682C4|nr:uncharacterized protein DDB_G0271670-like [Periophthalmus magnuspinnatus]
MSPEPIFEGPTFDCHPDVSALAPYGSSYGWWVHVRTAPPPGARCQAPTPGLASEWGTARLSADVTCNLARSCDLQRGVIWRTKGDSEGAGGVGSRSQVNLELSSPTADTDRPPAGTSPAKEDSSPDSNLTLESDSSGIFLSLSNQSQEEAGSDSDQPISGSDLGSSSTSLDKDGEDGEVMLKGSPHEIKRDMTTIQADVTTQFSQSKVMQEVKGTQLQKPEEGDFLCTDSFVYLAAPACLLLGPPGTTSYSGRESDSESSDSGPVDVSVHGCGSVAGDSDWDSDLSDSDPSRPPRTSSGTKASGTKASGTSRSKRPPVEPQWDLYEEPPEPECVESLGPAPSSPTSCPSPPSPTDNSPGSSETSTTAKRVTWQFKPAQRSVCTGSRKEKDVTSSGSDPHRPPPSSSSSSSSSPSSSSSG